MRLMMRRWRANWRTMGGRGNNRVIAGRNLSPPCAPRPLATFRHSPSPLAMPKARKKTIARKTRPIAHTRTTTVRWHQTDRATRRSEVHAHERRGEASRRRLGAGAWTHSKSSPLSVQQSAEVHSLAVCFMSHPLTSIPDVIT